MSACSHSCAHAVPRPGTQSYVCKLKKGDCKCQRWCFKDKNYVPIICHKGVCKDFLSTN